MKNQLYAHPIPPRPVGRNSHPDTPRTAITESLIAAAEWIIGLTTAGAVFWLFAVIMLSYTN